MELNDFLEMMKDRQTVKAGSEAMMFCHKMTQRALKMTAEINNILSYSLSVHTLKRDALLSVRDQEFPLSVLCRLLPATF